MAARPRPVNALAALLRQLSALADRAARRAEGGEPVAPDSDTSPGTPSGVDRLSGAPEHWRRLLAERPAGQRRGARLDGPPADRHPIDPDSAVRSQRPEPVSQQPPAPERSLSLRSPVPAAEPAGSAGRSASLALSAYPVGTRPAAAQAPAPVGAGDVLALSNRGREFERSALPQASGDPATPSHVGGAGSAPRGLERGEAAEHLATVPAPRSQRPTTRPALGDEHGDQPAARSPLRGEHSDAPSDFGADLLQERSGLETSRNRATVSDRGARPAFVPDLPALVPSWDEAGRTAARPYLAEPARQPANSRREPDPGWPQQQPTGPADLRTAPWLDGAPVTLAELWPALPDDAPLWTPSVRSADFERQRRLDLEQAGA